jgi:hypothetical protein
MHKNANISGKSEYLCFYKEKHLKSRENRFRMEQKLFWKKEKAGEIND